MSLHLYDSIDIAALLRYLTGESSPDERRRVEVWLDASDANRAVLHALQQGRDDGAATISVDVFQGMARLRERIDADMRPSPFSVLPSTPSIDGVSPERLPLHLWNTRSPLVQRATWTVWSMFLGVVVGVIGMVLAWRAGGRLPLTQFRLASSTTYATANGEHATITLPDGSTVVLNVASRVEIPADFASGNRTVRLVGEGLFTVVHGAGAPFTVIAGRTTARVLGTSFIVRHYATDTSTLVAVRDGKVSVRSRVLTASRQMIIDRQGREQVQPADSTEFSFATGTLSLNGVRMSEAIVALDRWYYADIRLGDSSLAAQTVTGEFSSGSLSQLMNLLEGPFNVRIVRDGRILTLYPK